MANNIIDRTAPGIVITETRVTLSDEKLKSALSKTYEQAQKDMSKPKFHKWYSVFLSIAGTLFLTLLTSKFNNIGSISAEILTIVSCVICVVCGLLGFILLGVNVSSKTHSNTEERDNAVNQVFNNYCPKEK